MAKLQRITIATCFRDFICVMSTRSLKGFPCNLHIAYEYINTCLHFFEVMSLINLVYYSSYQWNTLLV